MQRQGFSRPYTGYLSQKRPSISTTSVMASGVTKMRTDSIFKKASVIKPLVSNNKENSVNMAILGADDDDDSKAFSLSQAFFSSQSFDVKKQSAQTQPDFFPRIPQNNATIRNSECAKNVKQSANIDSSKPTVDNEDDQEWLLACTQVESTFFKPLAIRSEENNTLLLQNQEIFQDLPLQEPELQIIDAHNSSITSSTTPYSKTYPLADYPIMIESCAPNEETHPIDCHTTTQKHESHDLEDLDWIFENDGMVLQAESNGNSMNFDVKNPKEEDKTLKGFSISTVSESSDKETSCTVATSTVVMEGWTDPRRLDNVNLITESDSQKPVGEKENNTNIDLFDEFFDDFDDEKLFTLPVGNDEKEKNASANPSDDQDAEVELEDEDDSNEPWQPFKPNPEDISSDDEPILQGPESSKKIQIDTDPFCGLPKDVVRAFQNRGIKAPYPWQQDCLRIDGVLQGRNLIYSAPTSGGKTLVSEILLLLWTLVRRKKGIIILPFVSIVAEKVTDLEGLVAGSPVVVKGFYGNKGGDVPPDPMIAVCTIEKANALINRLAEDQRIDELGIVVCDELHMMGDNDRGYLLELLLTKLRYQDLFDLQIVGMSATLPNLQSIADWLDAALYITDFRPVPLAERIKIDDCIYDTNMNLVRKLSSDREVSKKDPDLVSLLCYEVVEQKCSTLVFCSTKKGCETCATMIASSPLFHRFPCSMDRETLLEELRRTPGGLDPTLEKTVPKGVAYHHAGLTVEERALIEAAYRKGVVQVLAATSTLAVGVNLPARRVILRSPYVGRDFLDSTRYKQMAGRAGRAGKDTSGESILIAKKSERDKVKNMIHARFPVLESCLIETRRGLVRALLEAIASQLVQSVTDIERFIKCTLLASQRSYEEVHRSACKALEFLSVNQFVEWQDGETDGDGSYKVTKLGSATVASGLAPEEGSFAFEELQKARNKFIMEGELHLIYLATPIYSSLEPDWNRFLSVYGSLNRACKDVANTIGISETFLIGCLQRQPPYQSKDKVTVIHRRFYSALILWELTHNESTVQDTASKYSMPRGSIQSLQALSSTFAHQIAVFCQKLSWWELGLLTTQYIDRLNFGVKLDVLPLCSVPELKGIRARALYDAGYKSVTSIALANTCDIEECIAKIIPFQKLSENGKLAETAAVKKLAQKIISGAQEIIAKNEVIKSPEDLIASEGRGEALFFAANPGKAKFKGRATSRFDFKATRRYNSKPSEKPANVERNLAGRMAEDEKPSTDVQTEMGIYPMLTSVNFDQLVSEWKACKEFSVSFHLRNKRPNLMKLQKKKDDTTKGPTRLIGLGISLPAKQSFYIKIPSETESINSALKDIFMDSGMRKIIADSKSGLHHLGQSGFEVCGTIFDPLIAAWLLEPEKENDSVPKLHSSFCPNKKPVVRFLQEPDAICLEAIMTFECMQAVGKALVLQQLLPVYLDVEMETVRVLYELEVTGMPFSVERCQRSELIINRRLYELEQKCYKLAGHQMKLNSPKEINHVLFKELGLNSDAAVRVRTFKGKQTIFYSTSEYVLNQLSRQHPLPAAIMEYRKLMHIKRSVVKNIMQAAKSNVHEHEPRIRPNYKQISSVVGRIMVVEPNLQSLPHQSIHIETEEAESDVSIKASFAASRNQNIVELFFPFIELRILSHLSQDIDLREVFETEGDPYTKIAAKCQRKDVSTVSKEERYRFKRLLDSLLQGQDLESACQQYKIPKVEAVSMMEAFKEAFEGSGNIYHKTICRDNHV
eukprot:TRINITY_DN4341_c0_g1_i19.p1 TRINITY_DN4341_c0_g1~~TRINITY_DN4341_c0_g1_i19.p1  ORF type:complete len:1747 (-),score=308.26 TRINITY_DN4341_c0_g1_i19:1105-6345(-)